MSWLTHEDTDPMDIVWGANPNKNSLECDSLDANIVNIIIQFFVNTSGNFRPMLFFLLLRTERRE